MAARPNLDFVLNLAWRETRGAGRHFTYLIACIALGVGALVAVGSFASSLERTVGRSARALMGGDVEIRSTQPLSAAMSSLRSCMPSLAVQMNARVPLLLSEVPTTTPRSLIPSARLELPPANRPRF
jgi:predicted lysophospholipase L1 biosynthesis ABC-type transport system permease subunit